MKITLVSFPSVDHCTHLDNIMFSSVFGFNCFLRKLSKSTVTACVRAFYVLLLLHEIFLDETVV